MKIKNIGKHFCTITRHKILVMRECFKVGLYVLYVWRSSGAGAKPVPEDADHPSKAVQLLHQHIGLRHGAGFYRRTIPLP